MESESRAAAAAQLSELSAAVDSANDNADPTPPWWAPLAIGSIGPAHVAIFQGSTPAAVIMVALAAVGVTAAYIAERRTTNARRRIGQNYSWQRFVGIFGLIIGLQIAGRWFASDARSASAWLLAPAAWVVASVLVALCIGVMSGRFSLPARS